MRYFRHSLCMFCASIVLAGCSYFDAGGERPGVQGSQNMRIDLMRPAQAGYPAVVHSSSGGAVEIYGFEGDPTFVAAPAVQSFTPLSSDASGEESPDPDVQIFPLDGLEMAEAPAFTPMESQPEPLTFPAAPVEPVLKEQPVDRDRPRPPVFMPVQGSVVSLFFGHNSADIDADSAAKIEQIAGDVKANGGRLTVQGHASATAPFNDVAQRKLVNLRVSMERAFSVARALVKEGVPADSITTIAWGESAAPEQFEGKTAEEAARRVDVLGGAAR